MKQAFPVSEQHPFGLPKIKHKKNSNLTHLLAEATENIHYWNRSSSHNDHSKEVLQQTFYRKHKQKLSKLIEK
jgi:hypothetical protein